MIVGRQRTLTLVALGCGCSKPLCGTVVTLCTVDWCVTSTRAEGAGVTFATLGRVGRHGLGGATTAIPPFTATNETCKKCC